MHDRTITLFNYHGGKWYPSIIHGVTLVENIASSATAQAGETGGDTLEVSIKANTSKEIETATGFKAYIPPTAYATCTAPADCLTFKPECDFICCGEWPTAPIDDAEYEESGLYHAMNEEYDGVYMITSAAWYGLIPHFEIGGR